MTYANPANITDLNHTLMYVHEVSGEMFFPIIIISLFVIVLVSVVLTTRRNNWIEGLAIASFITLPVNIIFFYLNYMSQTYLVLNLLVLAMSFILLIFWNR